MKHPRYLASWREFRLSTRVAHVVRPGGEALLLAGVALGCVQLGWGAVAPAEAGRGYTPVDGGVSRDATLQMLRSPFAPMAEMAGDGGGAALAAIVGVKVAGLRMADDAAQSGAILSFPDGRQRPFLVGHEVVEGVVLSEVRADRVVLAYEGGTQTIAVEAATPSGSFALALMGRSAPKTLGYASGDAPQRVETASAAPDAQWLMSTMAQVEMRNGAPYGWRVDAPPPPMAADAGLKVGDLILSVNGTPPGDPSAVFAAAASGRVSLAVEQRSGQRKILTLSSGMPS